MDIEVHVIAADILNGVRQSCQFCPVALAVERAIPVPDLRIQVSPDFVGFYPKESNRPESRIGVAVLPINISRWIIRFDTEYYHTCLPISFKLTISDDLVAKFDDMKVKTTNIDWLIKNRNRLCPIHGGKIHVSVVKSTYWCASCKRIWKIQRRHAGPLSRIDWNYAETKTSSQSS